MFAETIKYATKATIINTQIYNYNHLSIFDISNVDKSCILLCADIKQEQTSDINLQRKFGVTDSILST